MSETTVKKVVILGGGSAGWLTAGVLAAEYAAGADRGLQVTLVESPDVPTIGVGEGTWPSMRSTLKRIGISETEFLLRCNASFKQGTRFLGWCRGGDASGGDEYFHPFTVPAGFHQQNPVPFWQPHREEMSFGDAVCPQGHISRLNLAPKQVTTPEYAFNLNYGYHLDAGKFADLLQEHCTTRLGVEHLRDRVTDIRNDRHGYITGLQLKSGAVLEGDLFVDCSGARSLLLGGHYSIGLREQRDVLFNDSALAVQVPYPEADSPIASCTLSTAREAGWIWDIGLPSRRGVGYTFSGAHTSDKDAEQVLRRYLEPALGSGGAERAELRKISFQPGYREQFWHKNCVAIGMAAGFIEPLEASALVLVEQSARMLAEQLPPDRTMMEAVAVRFNRKFAHHWQRIIEFLKLHYVLSEREDSAYWMDHRDPAGIPARLQESLALWRRRSPWLEETEIADELFPAASYQYVLYGMGFVTEPLPWTVRPAMEQAAHKQFYDNIQNRERLQRTLPSNRELLQRIHLAAGQQC
ncbi:tryptophan halogenase family protein [Microbulbifer sp. YPW16]|uniref:tryptophan halogenase family protein n=1 Tax=Microbulbifer sp. YPW16 TaxID=2904242 RepID=UPI001E57635C|nr:tryptophan halogenase family protein [Microbulbifer sp. YPW16]UHQ53753.1 tryptophan 7-halogenase [Microbulbifer sp. YPW16]